MINITQDVELMSNFVAANPVPASNRFSVIRDEKGNPAILSHSSGDKLELIIEVDGKPQIADLGQIWQLPGRVQAFDVVQRADLRVFIAVATGASGQGKSHFSLIQDVMPSALLTFTADNLATASETFAQIHEVYMSNFTRDVAGKQMPLLFLASQPADRITQEDQLGYVDIAVGGDGKVEMSLNTSWKLATNPLRILAATFGTCPLGDGAFVLYTTTAGLKLQFRVFEGHGFSVELNAPAGATCLASYMDVAKGASVLLVGGDSITQYGYRDYTRPTSTGTPVAAVGSGLGLKDMHTAQEGDSITLWYITAADAAFYYATSAAAIGDGLLVPLLPEGAGARISGMLTARNGSAGLVKTLVAVGSDGNLTVLQQAADTAMWESRPLYAMAPRESVELDTFTVRIKAAATGSSDDEQVAGCMLHVKSEGAMHVLSNGVAATVDQTGGWHQADSAGVLTFIVPTADLACHSLTVDRFRAPNGKEQPLATPVLSPSTRIAARLTSIRTARDLLDAKTQSGKPLIAPGSVSEEDAGCAAAMIHQLSAMKADKTIAARQASNAKPTYLAGKLPKDRTLLAETHEAGQSSSPWDFFKYLFDKAKEVTSWFLQKLDDAVHFVCEWAGKIYRFVLDTASAVGKAISWVFAKIELFVEEVIDFIGFLFDWQYILHFSDTIVAFGNAGLSHSMKLVDSLDEKLLHFVDDLEKMLRARKQPKPIDTSPGSADSHATTTNKEIQQSPAYNWSSYQLQHGGFGKHSSMTDPTKTSDDDDPLADVWAELSKEVRAVVGWAEELAQAFKAIFSGKSSTAEFFDSVTDATVEFVCATLRNMIDAFLKGIKYVLQELKRLGNHEINVPIFTPLWNLVAGGRPCTLFNCVALVVAVPVSVLYKLTSPPGKNTEPPKLTEDAFLRYFENETPQDPEEVDQIRQVIQVQLVTGAVVAGLIGEVKLVTFATDSAGDVSPLLGNVIDCVTFDFVLLGLVSSWPGRFHHDRPLRWMVWSMEAANGLFLMITRLCGWKASIPRYETKRLVGAFEMVTGVPIYVLDLAIAVNEFGLPDGDAEKDDALVTLHVVGDTFQVVSCVGFLIAALADHVDPTTTAVGLAVFGVAFAGVVVTKVEEVVMKVRGG
ncbi:hypothetical protein BFW01_g7365 [Lasiodiplodia theobromae]|nr:hypothetical protein BFW01_g7365 [Lasiodiplodia theobromae]